MTKHRLSLVAVAVFLIVGCGNGHNGHGARETYLPEPAGPPVTTVSTGEPGDRWLDTMPYLRIARARRGNQVGYEASYGGAGGAVFTLFWSRDQIDFRGAAPSNYRLENMPLGEGRLRYPNRVTQESLPDVFRAIQILEHDYRRYADGEITWAQALADVAALGAGAPGPRAAGAGGGTPPRIPPARASVPSAAKAGTKGYKPFTSANFRENLARLTGGIPEGAQAHHIFPQKFANQFRRAGINIHDPRYGAWWQAGAHQNNAAVYNDKWQIFLSESPTTEQILQFGRELAKEYGLEIFF